MAKVLSKYIHKLGVSSWNLHYIFSLKPRNLEWIPKPVEAVILLCPDSESIRAHSKEEDAKLQAKPPTVPKDLFFMKQHIDDAAACGAIALVHGVANNPNIKPAQDSILKKYLDLALSLTTEERGKLLENDASFTEAYQELAVEGQTDANSDEPVIHHFVVFVNFINQLYELDGRKTFPIKHRATSDDTFLQDALEACKSVMDHVLDDVRCSVIALAPTLD